jgi:hypothetical protein
MDKDYNKKYFSKTSILAAGNKDENLEKKIPEMEIYCDKKNSKK